MIICAFGDSHMSAKAFKEVKKKAKEADIVLCLGDVSIFGQGMEPARLWLKQLKKRVLIIPGNHELPEEMGLLTSKNVINIHEKMVTEGDLKILGFGTGGFMHTSKEFVRFSKTLKGSPDICLFHQPPFKTKLDWLPFFEHTGNKDFTAFIKKKQPLIVFCGHLHENFHMRDKIGKSLIVNPGPDGELYEIKNGKARKL